jgi:hypothetical protein
VFAVCSLFALTSQLYGYVFMSDVIAEGCSTRYVSVCVRESRFGGWVHDLGMGDFSFTENDAPLVPRWIELLNACPSESIMVDIVLFLDLSTSMDDEISDLRTRIPEFVDGISGMNFRISMIIFNGCPAEITPPNVGVREIVRVNFSDAIGCSTYTPSGSDVWATDVVQFSWLFTAGWNEFFERPVRDRGSGSEDQYGALAYGAEAFDFRDGARKVFVLFTDERPIYNELLCSPGWGPSESDLASFTDFINSYGINVIPITPHTGEFVYSSGESTDRRYYDGYYSLGPNTGGAWFYLNSPDYSELVGNITSVIAGDSCCYDFVFTDSFFCTGINTITVNVPSYGSDTVSYSALCPPVGTWIVPSPFCGGYTSCAFQDFSLQFESVTGTGIAYYEFTADGITYNPSSSQLTLTADNRLTFMPSSSWTNGQLVVFDLFYALDDSGCIVDVEPCSVVVDIAPPVLISFYPPLDSIIHEERTQIYFVVYDSLSGVNWDVLLSSGATVFINGVEATFSLIRHSDTVFIEGLSFLDGDTVDLFISAVDSPDYDYCLPNSATFSNRFIVNMNNPVATLVLPRPYTITACRDQAIHIIVRDPDGWTLLPVFLRLTGLRIIYGDDYLRINSDTIFFEPPVGYYRGNYTLNVILHRADDIYGMPLESPLSFTFYTDFNPPVLFDISPPDGSILTDDFRMISFILKDYISGLDESSVIIRAFGRTFRGGELDYEADPYGTRISLDAVRNGIELRDGDTLLLRFCLRHARYMFSKRTTYTFSYFISVSKPVARLITPFPGTVSACLMQEIWMLYLMIMVSIGTLSNSGLRVFFLLLLILLLPSGAIHSFLPRIQDGGRTMIQFLLNL